MTVTPEQLKRILSPVRYDDEKLKDITEALNKTLEWYSINTPLRVTHFLAQVLHESGGFRYQEEIASGAAYEGRQDLGNTQPGDGKRYKGRGWIQLTGRANYTSAGKDFKQPFVDNPVLAGQFPWAALLSGWFWNKRKLNDLADKDDIEAVTRKVNGLKMNGLEDRKMWLKKAKEVLS
ncbi:MAG: glycoside hydrolase family 19 protein [Mucilaginibacter polytrichastri]|nr:glycoside hydrolase family 19 protein [Mucilaginibacter polytrichastri]